VLRARGRVAEARAQYERAIGLLDGAVEPDHPNLRAIKRNLDRLGAEDRSA
jgi:hypothetical protein